jgi:GNAT superfamily N-acetyltransferase
MVKLERSDHRAAFGLYRASAARFPLIGAVLLGEQDGEVYVDDALRPAQAYVEHAFGFAQVLGGPNPMFESALERHLLVDKRFSAPKIRLYTPRLPEFLKDSRYDSLRSLRQRFFMRPSDAAPRREAAPPPNVEVVAVHAKNVDAFETAFGVVRRFWRNTPDFVLHAHAVVVLHRGEPAAICYAAAQVDGEAEIDVLTRPGHQRLGLARIAVARFVERCLEQGLAPLWDCFENNVPSMQLSRAVGFTPKGPPYPFFTINK